MRRSRLGISTTASKTGWHGFAAVRSCRPASRSGFQVDGTYSHQAKILRRWRSFRSIDGTANVVYKFKTPKSKFRPYLIGGGGVYNLKAKGNDVGPGRQLQTKFGINAGAGFDFGRAARRLFVEGRFHNVFISGSDFQFIPITVGVRFGGSGADPDSLTQSGRSRRRGAAFAFGPG